MPCQSGHNGSRFRISINAILYLYMFKKNYFGLLLPLFAAVVTASGCSDNSADRETDDVGAVRFGMTSVSSRGVTGDAELQAKGSSFCVWGTFSKSGSAPVQVFESTKVTSDGNGEWSYDDTQYWFPSFTYDFRAIHPADFPQDMGITISGTGRQLNVTGFDAASDIDLLAAASPSINCDNPGSMAPVNLEFRHLLTRVVFTGRSDEQFLGSGRRIVVDRAVLYGMHTRGNWNSEPFTDIRPGIWTAAGDRTTAENSRHSVRGIELATDGTDLFTDCPMFFIPQNLSGVTLEITYHYNYSDSEQPLTFTSSVDLGSVSEKWESGKSYRYPFTISDHIFFETPTVEAWKYASIYSPDFNVDLN